ncbi:Protein of unknown function [Flavobacterium fontis]|uniref:DUF1761 domain-containing protein n=1 Tax=Flavobacterium fontis TaxID=1124188 RepID=A0A1M5B5R3_9FLAO|nr:MULTISPECIES: DUF1761 domain-containing protein [Flavobacterium]MCZ8168688.1 DUF1761 domain-containing protein [Flavobacterium sp.]MCZ8296973.1 DUF1761 domain-containing protein [Flavobacterium sp.]SHF37843.1 Protein of unknown function [Flavobacterium fontis]
MELQMNWIAVLCAAVSSLVIGFIWYHPKVMGTVWMRESGMTEEKIKGANMGLLFGMTFLFALMISLIINMLTIHQWGALGMIGGDVKQALPSYAAFMNDYGMKFRTFKHGALHGFMSGVLLALPLVGTNALYERRSAKYILIHGGYWIVCFTIMGGILCSMP